jgi:hypothetical protein
VILALTIDGAQLVGLVLGGVIAGWLAADATRNRDSDEKTEEEEDMALVIRNRDGTTTRLRNGEIARAACRGVDRRTGQRYSLDLRYSWDQIRYRVTDAPDDAPWHASKVAAIDEGSRRKEE